LNLRLSCRSFGVLCTWSFLVASCDGYSPSAPTGPAPGTETRSIQIIGTLDFNDVEVGQESQRSITIVNPGNVSLTVNAISATTGRDDFSVSWYSGLIGAGGSQAVIVSFTPTKRMSYSGLLVVTANNNRGNHMHPISARGIITAPLTQFGEGEWLVNVEILPGRYFAEPDIECNWGRTRQKTHSQDEDLHLGGEFWSDDAEQLIADIDPTDHAFFSVGRCNTWVRSPRQGPQTTIGAGVWLVGAQVAAGTYRADASADCGWSRLRDFRGEERSVIASGATDTPGLQRVTIRSSDAGFMSAPPCGTWTRE
jgi:hypothetical protein